MPKITLQVCSAYAPRHLKILLNYSEFREEPFLTELFRKKVKTPKYVVCRKEQRLRDTMLRDVRGMNTKDATGVSFSFCDLIEKNGMKQGIDIYVECRQSVRYKSFSVYNNAPSVETICEFQINLD